MRYRLWQFVVAAALLMTWPFLAGAPALVGFWSAATLSPLRKPDEAALFGFDEMTSAAPSLASLDDAPRTPSQAPEPPRDFPPLARLSYLPGGPQMGACGTVPPPHAGSGFAVPIVGLLDKPDIPRDQRGRRLALESNSGNLPSFPSRLLRPPRCHS